MVGAQATVIGAPTLLLRPRVFQVRPGTLILHELSVQVIVRPVGVSELSMFRTRLVDDKAPLFLSELSGDDPEAFGAHALCRFRVITHLSRRI